MIPRNHKQKIVQNPQGMSRYWINQGRPLLCLSSIQSRLDRRDFASVNGFMILLNSSVRGGALLGLLSHNLCFAQRFGLQPTD